MSTVRAMSGDHGATFRASWHLIAMVGIRGRLHEVAPELDVRSHRTWRFLSDSRQWIVRASGFSLCLSATVRSHRTCRFLSVSHLPPRPRGWFLTVLVGHIPRSGGKRVSRCGGSHSISDFAGAGTPTASMSPARGSLRPSVRDVSNHKLAGRSNGDPGHSDRSLERAWPTLDRSGQPWSAGRSSPSVRRARSGSIYRCRRRC